MTSSEFKIRAHHLPNFATLAKGSYSPEALAQGMVPLTDDYAAFFEDPQYTTDVLGTSKEGREKFIKSITGVFQQFIDLDAGQPVKLTNGERDGLCDSCMIGKHCVALGDEYSLQVKPGVTHQIFENQLNDMWAIGHFLALSTKLALEDKLPGSYGSIKSAETEPPKPTGNAIPITAHGISYQPSIIANAAYVKTVLAHWKS